MKYHSLRDSNLLLMNFYQMEKRQLLFCMNFKDQLTYLHLYSCFNEANDHAACNIIQNLQKFSTETPLSMGIALTATDIECTSVFLTSLFNKEWVGLNLHNCFIQDRGLNILYHRRHCIIVNVPLSMRCGWVQFLNNTFIHLDL